MRNAVVPILIFLALFSGLCANAGQDDANASQPEKATGDVSRKPLLIDDSTKSPLPQAIRQG